MQRIILLIFLVVFAGCRRPVNQIPDYPANVWWYDKPAAKFWEGLPVGTGRFAAMIPGNVQSEVITFNDETLWTGSPYNPNPHGGPEQLKKVRKLIAAGRYREADIEAMKLVSRPMYTQHYQPMGRLHLLFNDHHTFTDYRRELNMDSAIVRQYYSCNGINYKREIFASYPHQVIVIRISADKKGAVNFICSMSSLQPSAQCSADTNLLSIQGSVIEALNGSAKTKMIPVIESKMKWQAMARIIIDQGQLLNTTVNGSVHPAVPGIEVRNADAATIILAGATNFVRWNELSAGLSQQCSKYLNCDTLGYDELKAQHIADYTGLYGRCRLFLGEDVKRELTTTQRLYGLRKGESDPAFIASYFQYGRYLLMAAARENTLPFNNHNIWLDNLEGRWQGRWTMNINMQQCYWPVEKTHLGELNQSLLSFVQQLAEAGTITARELYGFNGWCAHHGTDVWMNTAPTGRKPEWAIFPLAGAWLCLQLYEHYLYQPDTGYLATIYPLLSGSSLFCLDLLVKDSASGYLLTSPSTSPENRFFIPGTKEPAAITAGSAMDIQIIRDLLNATVHASSVLKKDTLNSGRFKQALLLLAPYKTGKDGRILEWFHDFDEPEPDHRHLSHLFAVYPGDDLLLHHPELLPAVKRTIEARGRYSVGWSGAWRINLYARLREPEYAYTQLLKNVTSVSLHPYPEDSEEVPSFEGNQAIQAITAGVAEMLLQSYGDTVYLLPALPQQWREGRVEGLRARGAMTVDITWRNHSLHKALLRPGADRFYIIKTLVPVSISSDCDQGATAGKKQTIIRFKATAGCVYTIK